MKLNSVYVEDADQRMESMFQNWGWSLVYDPSKADLILFSGGSDVSPMLYEQQKLPITHNDLSRDQRCANMYYKNPNTPSVGICRGAQFLNVMCGGELYQDVDGHAGRHEAVIVETGEVIEVTSTHHQMMIPTDDAEIIMTANESVRRTSAGNLINTPPVEDIEVVFYEEEKCLCVQYHPEYVGMEHECQKLFFELIEQYLNLKA